MKIAEINSVAYGSTGNIMFGIASCAQKQGHEVKTFSGKWKSQKHIEGHTYFGSTLENALHIVLGRFLGINDCLSFFGTVSLIRSLNRFKPDIIHLHNLHSKYLCLPVLFHYIKHNKIPVVWTLHDCWAFTAHCPHFTMVKCDKWKRHCVNCPLYKEYPSNSYDNAKFMYSWKKKWFTGVNNLTIVTPSVWLANLVGHSFLKEYPVKVINNGIDLTVFKPTESDFRVKYHIPSDTFIILGVAFSWGRSKGLDVFIELSKRLDDNYKIVLVGTDENIDRQLPGNIISIHKTQDKKELAEIYTAADVFVNPTREEVFGLVNVEALACGTPVLTFNTGGSPECIDEKCGYVVACDDIVSLEKVIIYICKDMLDKEECLRQAKQYNMNELFRQYVDLYLCLNRRY